MLIYIYICKYIYTYAYVCLCIYIYVCICTYIYVYIYICIYAYVCVYTYIYIYIVRVYIHIYIHVSIYKFMYVCICKCIYVCIYKYIHVCVYIQHTLHHCVFLYGVATIGRFLTITGLFCRIQSLYRAFLQKRPIIFKEPTNRSHPIRIFSHPTHLRAARLSRVRKKGREFGVQMCV